jgi:L-lysine exporter family protein LysE/ArgO
MRLMLIAFLHGYALALGLILPLGPQNTFVLTQGAAHPRFVRALPVVVAAALSDTLLIALAVLGISVLALTIPWFRTALVIGGVAFLTVIGWLTWRSDPTTSDRATEAARWPPGRQVMFALSVSLLNPHAILDTIGVIGTSSLAYAGSARIAFGAGCALNSWVWFAALALVGRLAGSLAGVRRVLNRVSAAIMWASAAYLVIGLL